MIKNKILLLPILIFLMAFAVDKLLLIENIQTYFTKTMSEVNYFHKPLLFEEIQSYMKKTDRKKVLVYFGSSRGILFNNRYIEEKYPDWILFNFSVPGGTPDYFLYWLLKFQEKGIKPDFVLLDNSLEAFNLDASIKIDEVLVNGLDFPFIIKYNQRYTSEEINNFIAKRLFRTYQYRPNLKTVKERMKNDFLILKTYRKWRNNTRAKLILERGSASPEVNANPVSSPEFVKKYSEGDFRSYLTPFRFNKNMMDFQKDNLDILKSMNIPHAIVWVRIAPPYYELIQNKPVVIPKQKEKSTVLNIWKPYMDKILEETGSELWNMNDNSEYVCDYFTDASHLSSECFASYTDYLFKKISLSKN